jgi:hypothetical protein
MKLDISCAGEKGDQYAILVSNIERRNAFGRSWLIFEIWAGLIWHGILSVLGLLYKR